MAIQYQKRTALQADQKAEGVSIIKSSMKFRLSETEFYEQVTQRNGKLKPSDVIAIFETAREVALSYCNDGVGIRIPNFLDILPGVSGKQDVKGEWIGSPRKRLRVRIDKALHQAFEQNAVLEPIAAVTIAPVIDAVEDLRTGAINTTLSVGGSVAVIGEHLKFSPLKGDEGIFIIPEGGTEVKATRCLDNKPKRLTFEVPDGLPAGATCTFEVRMRHARNKALRTTAYNGTLLLA